MKFIGELEKIKRKKSKNIDKICEYKKINIYYIGNANG